MVKGMVPCWLVFRLTASVWGAQKTEKSDNQMKIKTKIKLSDKSK